MSTLFGKLKRIVHDEALKSGKEARLTTQGGETTVDKALADFAGDALGHLVRNAVNHGIERPKNRQRSGKSPCGTIHLAAAVASGMVEIDLLDDGAGIDHSALLAAARRHGLEAGDAEDLHSLVFQTGISTRTQTDLSAGRGVGLAAVRNAAHLLGGSIALTSEKDLGTHFQSPPPDPGFDHPSTPGEGRQRKIRPAGDTRHRHPGACRRLGRVWTQCDEQMNWRGRSLDLLDLGQCFGTSESRRQHGYVVVVGTARRERARADRG